MCVVSVWAYVVRYTHVMWYGRFIECIDVDRLKYTFLFYLFLIRARETLKSNFSLIWLFDCHCSSSEYLQTKNLILRLALLVRLITEYGCSASLYLQYEKFRVTTCTQLAVRNSHHIKIAKSCCVMSNIHFHLFAVSVQLSEHMSRTIHSHQFSSYVVFHLF